MVWQDTLIAIVTIVFCYSLMYQVYLGFREKRASVSIQTSLLTSGGLFLMAYAFSTLNLAFSAITSILTGILWALLMAQTIIYRK